MRLFVKLLLLLPACAPQSSETLRLADPLPGLGMSDSVRQTIREGGVRPHLREGALAELPMARRLRDMPQIPSSYLGEGPSPMEGLGEPILDVLEVSGGEALEEALDALPASLVTRLGVAALPSEILLGDTFHPGLCEDGIVTAQLDREGKDWMAQLAVPTYMEFAGDVEPYLTELTDTCQDGLAAAGGDIDAAMEAGTCIEEEMQQFFREGSACRACVEDNGGDFLACVEEESCPEEAPSVVWVEERSGPVWYQMSTTYIWACAPDFTILSLVLSTLDPEGELPQPFDHENWSYLCLAFWDESLQDSSWTCISGDGGPTKGDALGEGIIGRVDGMWSEDEDFGEAHANRLFYTPRMRMPTGIEIRWFWAFEAGAGIISLPSTYPDSNGNGQTDIEDENYGFGYGGWGVDPFELRPDGTDPTSTEDTLARDWLASLTVKSATTRDGVTIHTYNHNRCLEWEGPDARGSYRCLEMAPPTLGWQNDGQNTWTTSEFVQAYALPVATVASTGLADPAIYGGFVPLLAGSPALADPDWDDCVWPYTFIPDIVPIEDTPGDFGGTASVWAQSYRFGKDEDLDLRVVLNTNQARNFCPEKER